MQEIDAEKIVDKAIQTVEKIFMDQTIHAEILLQQVLKCVPDHQKANQLMTIVKQRLGQYAESIEYCKKSISIDPTCADNYNNMALGYAGLNEMDTAIECLDKALEMSPNNFLFMNNLGLQCRAVGQRDKAIELFERAAKICEQAEVWANLGGVYGEMKDLPKAEECFKKALEINPSFLGAHVDLSFVYHLQGRWKEGFAEYETRFDYFKQLRYYKNAYNQGKRWDGKKSLKGKRILLYGEQGLGDQLQFVRYCKFLKDQEAYVIVHCSDLVEGLIKRLPWVDETYIADIVTRTDYVFPEYDYQCSLMSLPYLLDLDHIPKGEYLHPIAALDIKSSYPDTFNIGICWAGSAAHPHDEARSVYARYFEVLINPKIKLFNLQVCPTKRAFLNGKKIVDYTEGCTQLSMVDMVPIIKNFDDSAAIVKGLDLIISVDTALVHLAGAMNVPCWLILPFACDWRWLASGTKTAWYDSIQIYRQQKLGDWTHVFEKIKEDLNASILSNQ
jgi:tetratricopeptide (TPR) repeat protein